jgi:drug/metabolite transporter (DMT)-like permease
MRVENRLIGVPFLNSIDSLVSDKAAGRKEEARMGVKQSVLAGVIWMVLCTGFQAAASGMVRLLSSDIGVFQLLLFHGLIGTTLMLPYIARLPSGTMERARGHLGKYFLRGFLSFIGMAASFYAYSVMDIANVQALLFTTPLFTIFLASLMLKEFVGGRGWIACFFGFLGALIIVRPGFIDLNIGSVGAVIAALSFAAANIVIRKLAVTENPVLITLAANVTIIPFAAVIAVPDWVWPSWDDVPLILLMGLCFMLAQIFLTMSIGAADARIVQSINFLRLPWAILFGWLMFAELPDFWTCIGAIVIFAAAYDVLMREKTDKK